MFKEPLKVRRGSLAEVKEIIDYAEQASCDGYWAVLALTYEAAPAFDPSMQVHALGSDNSPAIWAAVFEPDQAIQPPPATAGDSKGTHRFTPWRPAMEPEEYHHAIRQIKEHIKAGDTYQVNYTFPLFGAFKGEAEACFQQLRAAQQADYCVLLNLPDRLIMSISPELFFRRDNLTRLRTCPMKGTSRRGRFPAEDEQLRRKLTKSRKNRAENVMIVDLIRNDLGRIAETGSVKVARLFELERFPTVWQMISEIEAKIKSETKLWEIFSALFPCGSITGAPKISTMKIIKQLETQPRSIYTGTIGFLRPGGDGIFNVPIRTVEIDKSSGAARFGVGGGITADSTSAGEFSECQVKAAFLSAPRRKFSLLETMLLEDGYWFLVKKHLHRLQQSAMYFQFPFPRREIIKTLKKIKNANSRGRWKVRLLLHGDGKLESETSLMEEQKNENPLRLRLAKSPVDSQQARLFHKTTDREVYKKARREQPDCDEVILFNQRNQLTEGTIYNLVIEKKGEKYTPPVECGLLPGVFRRHLLEEGIIKEKILYPADLHQAEAIWLINSVRKWRVGKL